MSARESLPVIIVDLTEKKNPACGATRCGVSTCAPDEGLGTLGRSRWRILARGMTGRRWGFRRRNNRIFINVDMTLAG